jgi:hypothetical protein
MHATLIPADKRQAVARALQVVFGTTEFDALTPLTAGMSGALVYRVVVEGRPALLRIEGDRDALHDPTRQYACLATAADAGVAPPLRFADPEAGVAIMDFVAERPRAEYPGGGAAMALEVVDLLTRLQATPVFPPLVDYLDGVDAVIANMLATGVLDTAAAAGHLAAWREVRDAYPRLGADQLVSSHNDLNPGNILYDGRRLYLVDWEAAFANDPHVDPAQLALWFGLEGEAETALLARMFGEVDEVRRARFTLMRHACQMFYACLMLGLVAGVLGAGAAPITDLEAPSFAEVRAALGSGALQLATTEGKLLFAKASLNVVKDFTRSPAFAAAARALAVQAVA